MSMETRALGDAIRAARMKKGLTQDALSELLDITPTHLKNIEGSRRKPSVPLLFQMMELLDLSVDALVFQSREESRCLRMDGLSEREAEALERLLTFVRGVPDGVCQMDPRIPDMVAVSSNLGVLALEEGGSCRLPPFQADPPARLPRPAPWTRRVWGHIRLPGPRLPLSMELTSLCFDLEGPGKKETREAAAAVSRVFVF